MAAVARGRVKQPSAKSRIHAANLVGTYRDRRVDARGAQHRYDARHDRDDEQQDAPATKKNGSKRDTPRANSR